MTPNLSDYDTIAFDCDGIILDSNKVKTSAFYNAALAFGQEAAAAIRDYHVAHGGISRFKKFEWLYSQYLTNLDKEPVIQQLLKNYAAAVSQGLLECKINPALKELKAKNPEAAWMVVSGGAQSELREVFARRNLSALFTHGIFGSPDSKDEIFAREITNGNIQGKALFIGDSKYDYVSSNHAGLDFVFVSEWSEVTDWRQFCEENRLHHIHSLAELG